MENTNRNTAIWWIVGAIVVLLIIWAFVHFSNNGAGIPNTGTDTASTTDLYNLGGTSTTTNASSTYNTATDTTMMNAKG